MTNAIPPAVTDSSTFTAAASEYAVAGAVVDIGAGAIKQATSVGLTAADFADGTLEAVYAFVEDAVARGEPVSMELAQKAMATRLDGSTQERLIECSCYLHEVAFHAKQITEAAKHRRLRDASAAFERMLADPSLSASEIAVTAIEKIDAVLQRRGSTSTPLVTLADLPPPTPEEKNPSALFANGFLRKGGGALLVAPSGVGKSVWSIQAAALWAMGRPAFGITPVRPLKITIVQAEDDDEEMAYFRDQIRNALVGEEGLDKADVQDALASVTLLEIIGATGGAFVQRLAAHLRQHPVDLLIINPLQSYFGGDLSRNAELSLFLRGAMDLLIKGADGRGRVAVLLIHHSNKPPAAKDRSGWGTDAFTAYIGAGGAELTNWARAVLALMPVETQPGLFRLVAGKRGKQLGWTDAAGERTTTRFIAHHRDFVYWRTATEAEVELVAPKRRQAGDPDADAAQFASHLRDHTLSLSAARKLARNLFGRARGDRAFDRLKEALAANELSIEVSERDGKSFIGTPGDATRLARNCP